MRAALRFASAHDAEADTTAVVLFTSGSESLPKAVPLTHANLLANLRDVVGTVHDLYLNSVSLKLNEVMKALSTPALCQPGSARAGTPRAVARHDVARGVPRDGFTTSLGMPDRAGP